MCPWGNGAGGRAGSSGGSDVRLALNPQKSPYLEKCSILLLISAFASISLLVCAAAVLLSGREGEAEEAGERTPVLRMLGMSPSQICILLGATSCNPLASSTPCWACWAAASHVGSRDVFEVGGWKSNSESPWSAASLPKPL